MLFFFLRKMYKKICYTNSKNTDNPLFLFKNKLRDIEDIQEDIYDLVKDILSDNVN